MKLKPKQQKLMELADFFRCPLCKSSFQTTVSGALKCTNGHNYDISSSGTVNFAPNQRPMLYDGELFIRRRRIFEQGSYQPLLQKLGQIIGSLPVPGGTAHPPFLVDAGCGEGYYSKNLAESTGWNVLGFDLSKEAIALAARGDHRAAFVTADITNIPLQDEAADLILDVFTQSNYGEFLRILKPTGCLIKVIPGPDYLTEIRSLISGSLKVKEPARDKVAELFSSHFSLLEKQSIRYTVAVNEASFRDFFHMTPLTFGYKGELPAIHPETITMEVQILLGKNTRP